MREVQCVIQLYAIHVFMQEAIELTADDRDVYMAILDGRQGS